MSNFGFYHLRVAHPYDLAFREARSAVGASEVLLNAEKHKSVAEAVGDCSLVIGTTALGHRQLQHPLRNLKDGAPMILRELGAAEQDPGHVAILFGSEKFGLSKEDLSHCHWLMHIPMQQERTSMNLGQAVAVCLYELARGTVPAPPSDGPAAANAAELERMTGTLLDALHASGYVSAEAADAKEESVRRMVRRLNLSAEDATMWLGMLRQINWKLQTKQ